MEMDHWYELEMEELSRSANRVTELLEEAEKAAPRTEPQQDEEPNPAS
jgi:hypothetical protein